MKQFKKVIACALIAVLTLVAAAPAAQAAQSPTESVKPVTKEDVKAENGNTVSTNKKGTATVEEIKKTSKKSVTVSSKVTVDGVDYKVTTIGKKAFENAPKMTKVTLPSTIKTISKGAFTGAKKLTTITLKGTKSITVKKGAFADVNTKKMTITVSKKMSASQLKKLKKELKAAGYKGKVKRA